LLISIVCDDDRLVVIYWFDIRREIKWEYIKQIRIVEMGGTWCRVQTSRGNLDFPLSKIAGLEDSTGLIRKIIDNSDLIFVSGTRGMLAIYGRKNDNVS
jgi:hypothetical protein